MSDSATSISTISHSNDTTHQRSVIKHQANDLPCQLHRAQRHVTFLGFVGATDADALATHLGKIAARKSWKIAMMTSVTRTLLMCVLSYFFVGVGLSSVSVHLPAYVIAQRMSEHVAARCVLLMGAGSVCGRLLAGVLAHQLSRHIPQLLVTSCALTSLLATAAPFASSTFFTLATFSFLFAVCANAPVALIAPVCAAVNGDNLDVSYGVTILALGLGGLTGPPLAGM